MSQGEFAEGPPEGPRRTGWRSRWGLGWLVGTFALAVSAVFLACGGGVDAEGQLRTAQSLTDQGSWQEAISHFDRAIEAGLETSPAYAGRGYAYLRLNHPDLALEDFNRALALNPTDVEALNHRAYTLISLTRYEEALPDLDRALQLEPTSAPLLLNRGIALIAQGDYEPAIAQLTSALDDDPTSDPAFERRSSEFLAFAKNAQEYAEKAAHAEGGTLCPAYELLAPLLAEWDGRLAKRSQAGSGPATR